MSRVQSPVTARHLRYLQTPEAWLQAGITKPHTEYRQRCGRNSISEYFNTITSWPSSQYCSSAGNFSNEEAFFEDMDALEDWVLWVRYAAGQRFKYIPRVTSLFRTPADPAQAQRRLADLDSAYPLAQIRVSALVREFSAV